jgi:hypothetical protein
VVAVFQARTNCSCGTSQTRSPTVAFTMTPGQGTDELNLLRSNRNNKPTPTPARAV